jgi:hypothetical protein
MYSNHVGITGDMELKRQVVSHMILIYNFIKITEIVSPVLIAKLRHDDRHMAS